MSLLVQATPAPRQKTKDIQKLALAFATIVVVMAVAQLFTFEKFPSVISGIWLPGGDMAAPIYAAVIATLEVAAVPFLLSMRLSPLMRIMSMGAGWLVVVFWLGVSLWENLTTNVIANNGLFGGTISLPVGWWSVLGTIALGVLASWVSWGMWPIVKKRH